MSDVKTTNQESKLTPAAVGLKFPPNRMDLVLRQAELMVEAGYDISIIRMVDDSVNPPTLVYYQVNILCDIDLEEGE